MNDSNIQIRQNDLISNESISLMNFHDQNKSRTETFNAISSMDNFLAFRRMAPSKSWYSNYSFVFLFNRESQVLSHRILNLLSECLLPTEPHLHCVEIARSTASTCNFTFSHSETRPDTRPQMRPALLFRLCACVYVCLRCMCVCVCVRLFCYPSSLQLR